MAYHGYIPLIKQYLGQLKHPPSVLEVGVDRGVTLVPLVTHMAQLSSQFLFLGVDVLIQDSVRLMVHLMDDPVPQMTWLLEQNSLEVLPNLVDQRMKFDVVLLDGDHNYYTVSQEVQHLDDLVNPGGIVIIDDYDGKWSERDLYYSERPGYEEAHATPRMETEKQGVKPAVDEWLAENPQWKKQKPLPGEPILLTRAPI